ncbi:hypothetical protein EXIGLDRAFT_793434 [Exidia glandulosa HHB12029]|uniref:Uncharacterized protein n=1 Tax=Exidia glandulosa HHB12029 TaxID=1314781 RepID=A0A165GPN2_EXIGL|nr:hypothetical protein EXIGLDRAFT_793434 [Exidia glandulosa HHB12029]
MWVAFFIPNIKLSALRRPNYADLRLMLQQRVPRGAWLEATARMAAEPSTTTGDFDPSTFKHSHVLEYMTKDQRFFDRPIRALDRLLQELGKRSLTAFATKMHDEPLERLLRRIAVEKDIEINFHNCVGQEVLFGLLALVDPNLELWYQAGDGKLHVTDDAWVFENLMLAIVEHKTHKVLPLSVWKGIDSVIEAGMRFSWPNTATSSKKIWGQSHQTKAHLVFLSSCEYMQVFYRPRRADMSSRFICSNRYSATATGVQSVRFAMLALILAEMKRDLFPTVRLDEQ